jgi:hypothetical protein
MDAAMPMTTELTSGLMCLIVSNTAIPAASSSRVGACIRVPTLDLHLATQQDCTRLSSRNMPARTCCHGTTRGVDVHGDVLCLVHRVKVQQLGHHKVGHIIVHRATHAHDTLHTHTAQRQKKLVAAVVAQEAVCLGRHSCAMPSTAAGCRPGYLHMHLVDVVHRASAVVTCWKSWDTTPWNLSITRGFGGGGPWQTTGGWGFLDLRSYLQGAGLGSLTHRLCEEIVGAAPADYVVRPGKRDCSYNISTGKL